MKAVRFFSPKTVFAYNVCVCERNVWYLNNVFVSEFNFRFVLCSRKNGLSVIFFFFVCIFLCFSKTMYDVFNTHVPIGNSKYLNIILHAF